MLKGSNIFMYQFVCFLEASQELLNKKVKAKDRRVRDLEEQTMRVTEHLAVKVSEKCG